MAIVIPIVVVAVLVVVAAALLVRTRIRRNRLRRQFGPEYDRAIEATGSRRQAERELQGRAKQREQLDIRPLPPAAAQRYQQNWMQIQERFVDTPAAAVMEADQLVQQVLAERGYPIGDFDERANVLSVEHGGVIEQYRAAHAANQAAQAGTADTERMRSAMVQYRSLFERLLETDTGSAAGEQPYPDSPGIPETQMRRVDRAQSREGDRGA